MTQPTLHVADIGCVAARAREAGRYGRVEAVFERSFYVTVAGSWMCIGPQGLGAGPLNARCEFWSVGRLWSELLGAGDAVFIDGRTMKVRQSLSVSFETAKEWSPPVVGAWTIETLAHGLGCLARVLPVQLPADGLALLLRRSHRSRSRLLRAACQVAGNVESIVQYRPAGATEDVEDKLAPLLGLGPGLTPSGDDFLGGVLIALHLLGLTPLRDAIWTGLEPLLASATNDISAAHLAAAAEGYGSEALHLLLNDILTGHRHDLAARIQAVAAIGHTSGWDAFAGAVTVLRAYAT